jgi:O-antigen/teichoic acid export membrane protein
VSYSLNALIFVPLDLYQQSRIYSYKENNISLRSFFPINFRIFQIIALLSVILVCFLLFFKPDYITFVFLTVILAIELYLTTTLRNLLNNLEFRKIVSLTVVIEISLKIATFLIMTHYFGPTAILLLLSGIFSFLPVILVLAITSKRFHIFPTENMKRIPIRELFHFSYPISIGAVLNWLQLQGYRMLMVPLGFADMVGIYSTISNIGMSGMNANTIVFGQMFAPFVYKSSGKYTSKYIRNAFLLIVGVFLIGFLFSDLIVTILTKHDFVKYSKLICYGVIVEGGNLLCGGFGMYFTIKNKTLLGLGAGIFALIAVIATFGILYFFHSLSVYTVGLPLVISQIFICFYSLYLFLKYRRILSAGEVA